ncbi:MAG: DUF3795 domain-containing protein [Candidatus Saliniplasma sp.]
MREELIAPCGMNCAVCVSHFGYTMAGKKRKSRCPGCKSRDKGCSFLKKYCEKLSDRTVEFCFECGEFPCEPLERLDNSYREKYGMSMIKNLRSIKKNGMDRFLKEQEEKYRCPECGGSTCVHTNICYTCYDCEGPS